MAGIDELIDKQIEIKLNQRVAALNSKIQLLYPWIGTEQVKQLTGYHDTQWITNHFCIGKDGKSREAYKRGLVQKKSGRWLFKNPEFSNYLHDEYWNEAN